MNVDVVLAGSIQQHRDRIRVAVELVDVRGERIVWGKTFEGNAADLFELQDSIAAEVAQRVRYTRRSSLRPPFQLRSLTRLSHAAWRFREKG
jgi:TolB-like protein